MKKWFGENLPDYAERDDYKQLREANQQAPETAVMSEYGAMKWLQLNRPDYPQVVAETLEELKGEIRANKDAILGGIGDAAKPEGIESVGGEDYGAGASSQPTDSTQAQSDEDQAEN
jgi:hypothetical protein